MGLLDLVNDLRKKEGIRIKEIGEIKNKNKTFVLEPQTVTPSDNKSSLLPDNLSFNAELPDLMKGDFICRFMKRPETGDFLEEDAVTKKEEGVKTILEEMNTREFSEEEMNIICEENMTDKEPDNKEEPSDFFNIFCSYTEPRPLSDRSHLTAHLRHILKTEDHGLRNISVSTPCNIYVLNNGEAEPPAIVIDSLEKREDAVASFRKFISDTLKSQNKDFKDLRMQLVAGFLMRSTDEEISQDNIIYPSYVTGFTHMTDLHYTCFYELCKEYAYYMAEKDLSYLNCPDISEREEMLKKYYKNICDETFVFAFHIEPFELHIHRLYLPDYTIKPLENKKPVKKSNEETKITPKDTDIPSANNKSENKKSVSNDTVKENNIEEQKTDKNSLINKNIQKDNKTAETKNAKPQDTGNENNSTSNDNWFDFDF